MRYRVVKCKSEYKCPKCGSIRDAIVASPKAHYKNLYCGECGGYLKHPSPNDMQYAYITRITVADGTPISLLKRLKESELTMANKY